MNTNSNAYTIIYTTAIVVVVAAVLAFVSQSLKGKQEANEKADTISQMISAAQFGSKADFQAKGNTAVLAEYAENIASAFTVNSKGQKVADFDLGKVYSPSELKKLNYIIKGAQDGEAELPVFIFKDSTTVVPVYGAGLWGAIWGYIAFEPDGKTIKGAYFDHESETAGLGSKIKDDPAFQALFVDKQVLLTGDAAQFEIAKAGAHKLGESNGIDAIAGATMTSKSLNEAINLWLGLYKPLFSGVAEIPCEHSHADCEGEAHECDHAEKDCDKPCCQDKKTEE